MKDETHFLLYLSGEEQEASVNLKWSIAATAQWEMLGGHKVGWHVNKPLYGDHSLSDVRYLRSISRK